jgi:hypothetical protein
LEAVELGEQVAAVLLIVSGVLLGSRADRVEDEVAELCVGLERVKPCDELVLQRLGLDDRLGAVAVLAPGGALVAADACA